MNAVVIRAGIEHLELLLPLFAQYREFYQQASAAESERRFLADRIRNDEAVIFLALDRSSEEKALGFVQLYPSFDSVVLGTVWILHDLYVVSNGRRHGTGRLLMNEARDFCRVAGASRVDLVTAVTNKTAKALYESLGYERDDEFDYYSLSL